MDRQLFTVGLLVAGAVFAAGLGMFFMYLDRRRQRVRRRLEDLDRMTASELAATGASSILRDETLSSNPAIDRFLQRFSLAHRISTLLTQADISMRVATFFGLSFALAGLGGLITAAASGRGWAGLVGGAVVGSIPYWVVLHKKEKRRRTFERQFPDALDLMTGALRSGMAFTAALQVVSEESPDPVSSEFRIVFEEHRLGLSLRDSLQDMTKRIDSTELRLFVTAVLIQKETGGNLAEILDGAAYVIRDRFRILGDVRTITAQARLSGMILTILPLGMAVTLMILVPDYLTTLVTDPIGPYFIGGAIFMQLVGFLAIRKIVNIKV